MSRYPHDAKVYVGDLGSSASKQDLERSFGCNYIYERHTIYRVLLKFILFHQIMAKLEAFGSHETHLDLHSSSSKMNGELKAH